jgi:hypothetical protein
VSIGEALTQAREQAGLSIAQVSEQTRIRAAIIASIEDDDYGACGGDFYARGHIRAIGRAIGTDPEPLIRDYDAQRMPPPEEEEETDTLPAVGWRRRRSSRPDRESSHLAWEAMRPDREFSLPDWDSAPRLATPPQPPPQSQPPAQPPPQSQPPPQAQSRPAAARQDAQQEPAPPSPDEGPPPPEGEDDWRGREFVPAWIGQPAVLIGLLLVLAVAGGLIGYHLLSGSPRPVRASSPAGRHASPGSVAGTPSPTPTHSSAAPAATPLTPASATAFGVAGPGHGDHDELARAAIDGNPATAWQTDWYATADFGNLYNGTGLLLDLGRPATITAARIALGAVHGAGIQLRVGDSPSLAVLRPVAGAASAGGVLRLSPATPARGRYVLIWFTRLPPDQNGTFRGYIYDVRLSGRS